MFELKPEPLPNASIGRILILRTAQTVQVQWAIERLKHTYPGARFGVLGTQLGASALFAGMEHFELAEPWLSPRSFKPLRSRVRDFAPDMVVMCLNTDCGTGYGQVSRVVDSIEARFKYVADYVLRWHRWNHRDYEEGNVVTRGIVNTIGMLIYPVIALYLLLAPARPRYMPAGQGRPAPGYDR